MKGSDGPFVRIRGLGKRYGSVEALARSVLSLPYHLPKTACEYGGGRESWGTAGRRAVGSMLVAEKFPNGDKRSIQK